MSQLRQLSAAVAAEKRMKEMAEAPGPWKSNRKKVGMETRSAPSLVEEVDSKAKGKVSMKKGFLSGSGAGALYPKGSTESIPAEDVGNPLGWMPKGLRDKVSVVDTGTASEKDQMQMMKDYAEHGN